MFNLKKMYVCVSDCEYVNTRAGVQGHQRHQIALKAYCVDAMY